MSRMVSFGTLLISGAMLFLLSSAGANASEKKKISKPVDVREVSARKTFLDCFNEFKGRDGGWCEMSGASIYDVLPKSPSPEIQMVSGAQSVISAWNGAAFDPQRLKMYFHGGGHRDYGGNEVYELDLFLGRWTRLTDPSSIPKTTKEVRCPVPETGPPSSHTYDGIIFSRLTQTIFMIPSVYSCHWGNLNPKGDLWEFNPSKTETRNGLAALSWRHRKKMPIKMWPQYYRTVEYPNGHLYMANAHNAWVFHPKDGSWKRIGSRPNYGAGTSIYDGSRRGIWSLHGLGLLFTKPPVISKKWTAPGAGVGGHSGLAMTRDNKLIFWNGASLIHTFDPGTLEWRLFDWVDKGPKIGSRVYSKWVWVPRYDLYVGYSDYKSNVWVYRHPKERKGKRVNTVSIQPLLDKAAAGDKVTMSVVI
jgi:hypothetical protein